MTMEHQPEGPALRASDDDRELAATAVQEAHADGRLDLDEMGERLDHIYASKTKQELSVITADLEPAVHGSAKEVLTLRAVHSAQRREGQWQVPRRIIASSEHASIRLDFTEAVVREREVLVEVTAKHGSLQLIVPPGWRVDIDDVFSEHGSVKNKVGAPERGAPLLRVVGQTKHGSVVVRHPRVRRWWWPFGGH